MDFSYIAGFFDADGSISLLSIHKNEYKSVQVSFCNNERHRIAVALQYYNEVTNRNGKSTERAISRKEALTDYFIGTGKNNLKNKALQ